MLTGAAVIPVAVVGCAVELGEYELRERRRGRETGRASETVFVPLAHTEGGLSASMHRGARAAAESGGFRPTSSPTGSLAPPASSASRPGMRSRSPRWIEDQLDAMREWLAAATIRRVAKLAGSAR